MACKVTLNYLTFWKNTTMIGLQRPRLSGSGAVFKRFNPENRYDDSRGATNTSRRSAMRIARGATIAIILMASCNVSRTAEQSGALASPPEQMEEQVLDHLKGGRQSAAQELLRSYVVLYPEIMHIAGLFDTNKRSEARELVKKQPDHFQDKQRVFFLHAACIRSRFDVEGAFPFFLLVVEMDPNSAAGKCAQIVILLDAKKDDAKKDVDARFTDLEKLADANPDDVAVRWMLAVQCRSYDRNKLGAEQYKKILEKWNPGPSLVHQTYANLLDALGRYDEALVERRKTIEMEPNGWSYDGLAVTLRHLKRYKEAEEASAKAVVQEPLRATYWSNWALTLIDDGKIEDAIAKCQRSLQIDPTNWRAMDIWGDALRSQGKKSEALAKYQDALKNNPKSEFIQSEITALKKELDAESKKSTDSKAGAEKPSGKP
jgi:tetratricopeptide (TPR) repeat protein